MRYLRKSKFTKIVVFLLLFLFASQQIGLAEVINLRDAGGIGTFDVILAAAVGIAQALAIKPGWGPARVFASTYLIPVASDALIKALHIKNPIARVAFSVGFSMGANYGLDQLAKKLQKAAEEIAAKATEEAAKTTKEAANAAEAAEAAEKGVTAAQEAVKLAGTPQELATATEKLRLAQEILKDAKAGKAAALARLQKVTEKLQKTAEKLQKTAEKGVEVAKANVAKAAKNVDLTEVARKAAKTPEEVATTTRALEAAQKGVEVAKEGERIAGEALKTAEKGVEVAKEAKEAVKKLAGTPQELATALTVVTATAAKIAEVATALIATEEALKRLGAAGAAGVTEAAKLKLSNIWKRIFGKGKIAPTTAPTSASTTAAPAPQVVTAVAKETNRMILAGVFYKFAQGAVYGATWEAIYQSLFKRNKHLASFAATGGALLAGEFAGLGLSKATGFVFGIDQNQIITERKSGDVLNQALSKEMREFFKEYSIRMAARGMETAAAMAGIEEAGILSSALVTSMLRSKKEEGKSRYKEAIIEGLESGLISVGLQALSRQTKSPVHGAYLNLFASSFAKSLLHPKEGFLVTLGASMTEANADFMSFGRATAQPNADGTFDFAWHNPNDVFFIARYTDYIRDMQEYGVEYALASQYLSSIHYQSVNNVRDILHPSDNIQSPVAKYLLLLKGGMPAPVAAIIATQEPPETVSVPINSQLQPPADKAPQPTTPAPVTTQPKITELPLNINNRNLDLLPVVTTTIVKQPSQVTPPAQPTPPPPPKTPTAVTPAPRPIFVNYISDIPKDKGFKPYITSDPNSPQIVKNGKFDTDGFDIIICSSRTGDGNVYYAPKIK